MHFLYTRYGPEIGSGVRELVADDRAAQAVTESVFRELVNLVDDYEPEREPFVSWLLGVSEEVARGRSVRWPGLTRVVGEVRLSRQGRSS